VRIRDHKLEGIGDFEGFRAAESPGAEITLNAAGYGRLTAP